MDPKFENYKTLKNDYNIVYRGYTLNSFLAAILIRYSHNNTFSKPYRSLYNLFIRPKTKTFIQGLESDYLFTTPSHRKDHKELVNLIASKFENSNTVPLLSLPFVRFSFPKHLLNTFKEVFLKKSETPFLFKFNIFSKVVYAKTLIDHLEETKNIKTKCFIAFNSSYLDDALLTQYFQKKGIPTYSLQHGVYTSYGDKTAVDIINYENITADFLLCWGKGTINTLIKEGLKKEKLLLAGNPKYQLPEKFQDPKWGSSKVIVFLARSVFQKGNKELLLLLQQDNSGNIYEVKLHPSLSYNDYKSFECKNISIKKTPSETIQELFSKNKYSYAISYNSTVYYEALNYGIPCFRFKKYTIDLFEGLNDEFDSIAELKSKFQIQESNKNYDKDCINLIQRQIGSSIDNYVDLIKQI